MKRKREFARLGILCVFFSGTLANFINTNLRCKLFGIDFSDCLNSVYRPRSMYESFANSFNLPVQKDAACAFTPCKMAILGSGLNRILSIAQHKHSYPGQCICLGLGSCGCEAQEETGEETNAAAIQPATEIVSEMPSVVTQTVRKTETIRVLQTPEPLMTRVQVVTKMPAPSTEYIYRPVQSVVQPGGYPPGYDMLPSGMPMPMPMPTAHILPAMPSSTAPNIAPRHRYQMHPAQQDYESHLSDTPNAITIPYSTITKTAQVTVPVYSTITRTKYVINTVDNYITETATKTTTQTLTKSKTKTKTVTVTETVSDHVERTKFSTIYKYNTTTMERTATVTVTNAFTVTITQPSAPSSSPQAGPGPLPLPVVPSSLLPEKPLAPARTVVDHRVPQSASQDWKPLSKSKPQYRVVKMVKDMLVCPVLSTGCIDKQKALAGLCKIGPGTETNCPPPHTFSGFQHPVAPPSTNAQTQVQEQVQPQPQVQVQPQVQPQDCGENCPEVVKTVWVRAKPTPKISS
ncbi:hypothetical protein NECID01_1841 [Nematocida sp. AWRm77]|nr:hypothetical protein NECID01_1841 [Nematocida sp. AWRm77]